MSLPEGLRGELVEAVMAETDRLRGGPTPREHVIVGVAVDTILSRLEQVGWFCQATDDPDRMVVLHNNGAPVPPGDNITTGGDVEAQRLYRFKP